jgi:prevent-host-death family protein
MSVRLHTIVPISELQVRSKALVEQVRKTGLPIVVTQQGRPAAVLVSYELYEGHLAALDEMSFPDWEERLARARGEIATGKLIPHERVVSRGKRGRRR